MKKFAVFLGVAMMTALFAIPAYASHGAGSGLFLIDVPQSITASTSEMITVVPAPGTMFYLYSLDGGAQSPPTSTDIPIILNGLSEGSHKLEVFGLDEFFNLHGDTVTYTWLIQIGIGGAEAVSPTITIANASGSFINDPTPTLVLTLDDVPFENEGAMIRFSCDGENWTNFEPFLSRKEDFNVNSGFFGCTPQDGMKVVAAQAMNMIEELSNIAVTDPFFLDSTPPDVLGLTSSMVPTQSYTWMWNSSDESAGFRFSVDADPNGVPMSPYGPATAYALESGDGTFYIHVQAIDPVGNESLVETAFTVLDNTAPTFQLSNLPHNPTKETSVNILVTSEAPDYIGYRYVLNGLANEELLNRELVLTELSDGPYILQIFGYDQVGNSFEAPPIFWNIDSTLVMAVLSNMPSNPTTSTGAEITVGGTGVFFYRHSLDGGTFSSEFPVSAILTFTNLNVGPHTVSVIGRGEDGQYPDPLDATMFPWTIESPPAPPVPSPIVSGAPAPGTANSLYDNFVKPKPKPKVLGAETSVFPDGMILQKAGTRVYFLMRNNEKVRISYGQLKKKYKDAVVAEVLNEVLKSIPTAKKKPKKSKK